VEVQFHAFLTIATDGDEWLASCPDHFILREKVMERIFLLNSVLGTLTVTQLVKKFPTFYGTQRLITMFTRAHHWSLS
jgi:regulator of sirC expression with transglutaminase-like and TPR domain